MTFELGKNRIEALSDGIFAIAMTLLILELHVPDLAHNAGNAQLWPALKHLGPKFLTYGFSFITLGVYWVGHHNMYHAIRRSDRVLLSLNILFFMLVSFLPFATSILNAFPMAQIGTLLFGANIAAIGWILCFQWIYASRKADMLQPYVGKEYRDMVATRFFGIPLVVTVTTLVCFWSIPVCLGVYLICLPFYMIPGRVVGRT